MPKVAHPLPAKQEAPAVISPIFTKATAFHPFLPWTNRLSHLREIITALALLSAGNTVVADELPPAGHNDRIAALVQEIDSNSDSSADDRSLANYQCFQQLDSLWPQELWPERLKMQLYITGRQLQEMQAALLEEAEKFYGATLYSQAIDSYRRLLKAMEQAEDRATPIKSSEMHTQVICRLAQAQFFLEDYSSVCELLCSPRTAWEKLPPHLQKLESQTLYIHALACRHLGRYSQAIALLKSYLTIVGGPKKKLQCGQVQENEVFFELALNNYLSGDLATAQSYLEQVDHSSAKADLRNLAELYRAKIMLTKELPAESDLILAALSMAMPQENPLHFEVSYLRGCAAQKLGHIEMAINHFKHALPVRNGERASWYLSTLYRLGWSSLEAALQASNCSEHQKALLLQAQQFFGELVQRTPDEHLVLTLAYSYQVAAQCLKDNLSLQQLELQLSALEECGSIESKAYGLLMRAECASHYSERQALYAQLTSDKYKAASIYARAWYARGINEFLHAEELPPQQASGIRHSYVLAAEAMGNAFNLLQKEDPSMAAAALKYHVFATYRQGGDDHIKTALHTLEEAFEQHAATIEALPQPQPQELTYLYGLMALELAEKSGDSTVSHIAECSLWQLADNHPESPFAPRSLHLLGCHYWRSQQWEQAERAFGRQIVDYRHSEDIDVALHWCAVASEHLKRDPAAIRGYRHSLYSEHPSSPLAPSAYFHYYGYRDYLQGDKASIVHLQALPKLFPDTPYMINGYYLLGLDAKRSRKVAHMHGYRKRSYLEAIEAFNSVEKEFDRLYKRQLIPAEQLAHYAEIRYRALLECALANQAIGEESQGTKRKIYQQYAEELFISLNRELSDSHHPFTRYLFAKSNFPSIYQESLYCCLKNYINAGQRAAALALVEESLDKYHLEHITQGYFLSRTYYEQGCLAVDSGEFAAACHAFALAEKSNNGLYLTTDQRLDLWIQQSLCYKALQQPDQAMLLLSKVINDDAVSSLRIQAMFLRSDLYALQGRYELARKQLQAVADKGGEWAEKAKEKLEQEYGFE
jgi:tetratricopeptide (TPR) repeat protein